MDTLRWLTGEESISGTVSTEEDVPIQHTREQDVVWFYATVLLAPAVVLGVGFFVTRRRGRRAPARRDGRRCAMNVRGVALQGGLAVRGAGGRLPRLAARAGGHARRGDGAGRLQALAPAGALRRCHALRGAVPGREGRGHALGAPGRQAAASASGSERGRRRSACGRSGCRSGYGGGHRRRDAWGHRHGDSRGASTAASAAA